MALARQAFASVADCAMLPMQDALNLGSEGRMNTPGQAFDNWAWRMTKEQAIPERLDWLRQFARLYGRLRKSEADANL
jgi:4-alpha-glucanotransferase